MTERGIANATQVFQPKIGHPATASVNCDSQQKARREAGLIDERNVDPISRSDDSTRSLAISLRELGDLRGEPRDFAAGVVLVDDVALRGTHQSGLGIRHRLQGSGAVAGLDGFLDGADGTAHLGAARLVDGGAAGDLARRFLGGSGVGHGLKCPLR